MKSSKIVTSKRSSKDYFCNVAALLQCFIFLAWRRVGIRLFPQLILAVY